MENKFATACWIWHPEAFGVNETVDFLAEFTVKDPAKCRMVVSVNSHYALYLNEAFAANDQFPDYEHYKVYDELCLEKAVQPGRNTLCLSAYCQGDGSLTYHPFPAGALFAVYEGETLLAASGAGTLCRRNTRYAAAGVEKITGQLSYSFRYDAEAALPATVPATVYPYEWPLHARPVKKLVLDAPEPAVVKLIGHFEDTKTEGTVAQRMQAAALTTAALAQPLAVPSAKGHVLKDNLAILDLGKEQVGYFVLDVDLPESCDVAIGWGEHLEDLRVRTDVGTRNFAALYHGHAGRNTFFYPFKRMGLRYVQLQVYASGFTLYYAGVRPARYPLAKVELFECADHLHAQIYRTSLRTLQGCMHDHYEDCPWREQALYTMDSRNQMLCGYYAFHEFEFARASLRMLGLSLRADHTLELTSPGEASITIPSFTAIYLIQLGEYVQYSDDEAFAREMLPAARDIAEGFLARVEENGLIRRLEGKQYWNFYEWQTGLDGGPIGDEDPAVQRSFDAPLSAFVSLGLTQLAAVCRRLGETEAAQRYAEAAQALNRAIDRVFWLEDKGCYATTLLGGRLCHTCELTQALAVCCGAVPAFKLDRVLATLTGSMGPDFYPVTLSHSIFKYEALLKRPAQYARFVFDHVAQTFGAMLYKDATTFWETADGPAAFENAGSLCHAWSAIPAYLYLRYCADSLGEGGALPCTLTGIYEPRIRRFEEASRRILDDSWNA